MINLTAPTATRVPALMSQWVNPTTLTFNDKLDGSQPFLSPSSFPQPPPANTAELCLACINPPSFQHQTWEVRWKRTGLGEEGTGGWWCSSACLKHPCLQLSRPKVLRTRQVHEHPQTYHLTLLTPTLAGNATERQRGPAAPAASTRAQEMNVILGCSHKGGGRSVVTRPHGTRSPLQGCCLQCSRLCFQPEQESLERVQKRAGSESRQWKICITVTERGSSVCLVY